MADHLLLRNHEVAIVDDLSSGKRANIPEGVRFYEADIRSGCAEDFEEFEPEVLCHQAAQMDVRRSVAEPDFDADVNILGTVRLIENCIRHDVERVIFASTGGAIYGKQYQLPADEDHPKYPVSPYGVSKLAGERYLHYYHVQYDISYIALRYANGHRARQVDAAMLEEADLVLAMTPEHAATLRRLSPDSADRVHTLVGYAYGAPEGEGIADPYGQPMSVHRASVRRILECVQWLIPRLRS